MSDKGEKRSSIPYVTSSNLYNSDYFAHQRANTTLVNPPCGVEVGKEADDLITFRKRGN